VLSVNEHNFDSFVEFEKTFAYKDEFLYSKIFERNKDNIKVNKEKFAVKNLQKIFNATFLISPKIGFQAMSLRDLSAETGLSMGGLYSSIANKDAIAVIVKDIVSLVCADVVSHSVSEEDPNKALQALLRGYLYSSTIMHSWFNFLYFETKSLSQAEQIASKAIELEQATALKDTLNRLKPDSSVNVEFVSSMIVSMVQERYVKPWKYNQPEESIDEYADDCIELVYKCMDYKEK